MYIIGGKRVNQSRIDSMKRAASSGVKPPPFTFLKIIRELVQPWLLKIKEKSLSGKLKSFYNTEKDII
ncbi:hypothetical protein EG345_05900 [Chryseobacterium carnipullorum]|nr:hypothetical protein EG345_05900 [Chryseobacterium carnipullorum]